MNRLFRTIPLLLVLCVLSGSLCALAEDVIDPDLTCTITLGNWPPDTAAAAEKELFEGYRATMARQYPNVTLVPDYYSYSLSNYVPMAKGGTAPSIFQPPFTDPQLLISQHLVGDVTDALEQFGVLDQFSPSYWRCWRMKTDGSTACPGTAMCWACTSTWRFSARRA